MEVKWLPPTRHVPDWHLIDADGTILGEVSKAHLGYQWIAYAYAPDETRTVKAGGGAIRSLGSAKRHVEEAIAQ